MEVTAVVVRAEAEAVLVLPAGLPTVEVSDEVWFPDVEAVTLALRDQLGIDAYVLTCLSEDPATYLLVSAGAVPPGAQWVHDLDDPAVTAGRQHLALPPGSPVTPAWTMPSWY